MRFIPFFIVISLVFSSCQQKSIGYKLLDDRLTLEVDEGTLNIIPLADGAIRVQLENGGVEEDQELVLVNRLPTPDFKVSENDGMVRLSTRSMSVLVNKQNGHIEFFDSTGAVFLREMPGSRKMIPDSVMGEACSLAEQSFDSPEGEFLFGLGQFQDGHYNLKNLGRKLIQVNSQIAIPFLYSSKGYGILWHQYGLTEFNPADNAISLSKKDAPSGEDKEVEVTTTSGTQKVSQRQSLYEGIFNVEKEGEYSVMLDLGDMDSRHLLIIDGEPVIDQSNLWLPPAVSELVSLSAGEHTVQIICSSTNTPKLSWKHADNTTTFRSPHAKSLDYVVFKGNDADEVFRKYRDVSGHAPMLPRWAYGFWQCRERYTSSEELVNTVKEFRRRNLPMDVIVQDWQYWGNNGWGVPQLDKTRYPNPSGFIKEIHDLNAHFTISIWSNPDKNSELGKWYTERGLFIPETKWLDYFNPETSKSYWTTLKDNLFVHGVDAWWMDATEPENDALTGTMTHQGPGDFYRLTYPLYVSKSVFDGQKETNPDKRVTILTRSAFAGQQRYGTINWSGDIGGTWDGYRRQIVSGSNFTLTGMPYWTTDIGGFFRPGGGQYTDPGFRELLTRWFQWGAFSTIFRIHGYQSETEPWKYGTEVEENMRKMLNIRYRLLPYIYSNAWKISNNGSTMMRPMVMDFQDDAEAVAQAYQYMFGQSILVTPVTDPKVSQVLVYLPKSANWYDFWTGKLYSGGQSVQVASPIDQLPLFVKAGTILPLSKPIQHTQEQYMDTLEIRVYAGANGTFELYDDEGDNYSYEEEGYNIIPFSWEEQSQTLNIGERKGGYKEGQLKQVFHIVWIDESAGYGIDDNAERQTVSYDGTKLSIKR